MTKKIILQLSELTCPSCLTKIEGALSKEDGISDLKVLFNSSKVKANFDDHQITPEAMQNIIEKLGYDVESLKVKDI